MPSVDLENPFEKRIVDDIRGLPSDSYDILAKRLNDETAELRIIPKIKTWFEGSRIAHDTSERVLEHLVRATYGLTRFGLSPVLITLGEFKDSQIRFRKAQFEEVEKVKIANLQALPSVEAFRRLTAEQAQSEVVPAPADAPQIPEAQTQAPEAPKAPAQ